MHGCLKRREPLYKYILFDLDGTLLDTTQGVIDAVKITVKQHGFSMPSDEVLKTFVGPPMQKSMAETFNLDKETALQVANNFRANYKKYSLYKAELYTDVIEMFEKLIDKGFKIAIATNKSHENAEGIIKYFGLDKYCDFYMGSDLTGKLTKADIVEKCIEVLNADKKQTVLIGDSEFDLVGAKQAGIDFLGVTYGFGFKNPEDIQGNLFFNNVKALTDFLTNQKENACIC